MSMKRYRIRIVYDNQLLELIELSAVSQSDAETKAFDYADSTIGKALRNKYDMELVELYFIDNPRHRLLFG